MMGERHTILLGLTRTTAPNPIGCNWSDRHLEGLLRDAQVDLAMGYEVGGQRCTRLTAYIPRTSGRLITTSMPGIEVEI